MPSSVKALPAAKGHNSPLAVTFHYSAINLKNKRIKAEKKNDIKPVARLEAV
jgi:hypothetical protein